MTHATSNRTQLALQYVDKFSAEAVELLGSLVAVPSVNPKTPGVEFDSHIGGEKAANELFAEALEEIGLEISWAEAEVDRPNLCATRKGTSNGKSLALAGHIDTVPPTTADQTDPVVKDGRMIGVGTTDMKGGLVAAWLAAKAIDAADLKLRGDLMIHSVVGEETMDHLAGTTALLEAGRKPDAVIVAEPTSSPGQPLGVHNTAAGNYLFRIRVTGKSTHWASRNLAIRPGGPGDRVGVNAIDKAFLIYSALRDLETQWGLTKNHEQFLPGASIIHPGVMRASAAVASPAYFPDSAEIDYLLSFPPGFTSEEIRQEVEDRIRTAESTDTWLRSNPSEIEWIDTWPPAFTDPDSEFVKTVLDSRNKVAGQEGLPLIENASPAGAQSDASFYEAFGIPSVVCGPGDLRLAHSKDESIDLEMVFAAAKTMVLTAAAWCEADGTSSK